MGRVLILGNSSGGLFDFRNEFVEALLKENQVFVSVPDDVKTKELTEEIGRASCRERVSCDV